MMIRKRRESLEMTQMELARRARISQSYVSQLEAGERKTVSLPIAQRLARALEMTLEELTS
jgi:transcriptional regulator with XRE-family HTH domain